jgi:hypothetical protein
MRVIVYILCLLPFLYSCHSTYYTPKTHKGRQLSVGSSGGVTGMMKEFVLLDNGQLFLSKGIQGEWKELRSLKRSQTKDIFSKVEDLGLGTLKFSHPGNMTYYFILKVPPRSNEIKWGETGVSTPEGIDEFYDYLISIF